MTVFAIVTLRTQWNFRGILINWIAGQGNRVMKFQPVKCNMMQLTRKWIKKIYASYPCSYSWPKNVESIKYLGVTITNDLRWNTHVTNVCTKANRTLGFLRQNLYSCPQKVKEAEDWCASPGVWQFGLGTPRCSPSGRIRKRAKARSQIRDWKLQLWNWEYDCHFWTVKMGIPQEKEERQ